ncbi:MAG: hypothetical protein AB1411_03015 [Nitrospirota bacterium]
MRSWKTPTPEQVDRAIALLAHPELRRYFFDRLENPHWLEPLKQKGFFGHPPAVVRDEGKGTVRFPPWPESRYLARMAVHNPAKVLEIALSIETDNIRVNEDLLDAALAMPAEMAATLASKAPAWIERPYSPFWPEKFGDLVGHLARGNQVEVALTLAQKLLAVLPSQGALSQARARFEAWHYEGILEKNLPDLIAAAGVRALNLLCDLLNSAMQLSREHIDEEGGEDYSYIWRPAIEGERHRGFHEIRDLLVSAVRDAAIQIVRKDQTLLASVLDELERRPWKIFRRIGLHVSRSFPGSEPDLVRSRLMNRTLFEDRGTQREYALMLRNRFSLLSADDQTEVLGWIEQGPDLDRFWESRKAWGEQIPTEEESAAYAGQWRLRRLRWIRDSLPTEWKQRYDALVQQFGEPQDPEMVPRAEAVRVGPRAPKSQEELGAMSATEVIAYLKSWLPSDDALGPSPEGLGRQLKNVVAAEPDRFAQSAFSFREVDPTYVRAVLEGLHDAARERPFPWEPVLDLCLWVVTQPREIEGRTVRKWDADPDWGATRSAIARLLSVGLQEGQYELPMSLRTKVWKILWELTEDPEPSPQYEREFGGTNMDPVAMSINTVRGEAMHTVVRYALWVRRYIAKAEDAEQRITRGFGEMPEVTEVLEAHLDPAHDPSLAVRAVYGEWLPWLVLLDRGWTTDNLSRIFPDNDNQRNFRDAAWEAYIVFCQPYDDAFYVIKDVYARAVERIGTVAADSRHRGDPDQHLAEHLMVFYWRGKLDVNEQGGVLGRFYEKAPDSLRAHAIEFIGRSLSNTEGAVEAGVLDRLRSIWAIRLGSARAASNRETHAGEMAAFGWWFASGKFDDPWAVEQLFAALSLIRKIDAGWLVLERLAALAEAMPNESVRCALLMIEGDLKGWEIHGWRNELRAILSTVIRSTRPNALQGAVELVNRLGAKGFLEFRDLLPSGDLSLD